MEPALVGLCLFCFGEFFFASIRLGVNLEFVILSLEEYSGETAPIGPSNCCSVILVVDWCMDNTLQWYSWMLWDGILLGTVLQWSWIFVHRFEAWRRIWTCLEDIEISFDELRNAGMRFVNQSELRRLNAWVHQKWFWNWTFECKWNRSHRMYLCEFKEPGMEFPKTHRTFQRKLCSVNFVFGRNFHRKFLDWDEPSLNFGLNWVGSGWVFVVEFVAVSSWSCCWHWLTGLTSRRWLPVSLNDDKWPCTRHHVRWLNELLVVWGGQKRLQCCCYLFMVCLCLVVSC